MFKGFYKKKLKTFILTTLMLSGSLLSQTATLPNVTFAQASNATADTPAQSPSPALGPEAQITSDNLVQPTGSGLSNIIGGEVLKPKDDKDVDDAGQEADIYLNFDNASIASIVNYLGEQKKINVIPHKDLATVNVTMSTRQGLTLERAWNVLLTLLEINGFSMIKVGDVYRIVSNKENKFEPLPTYSSGTGTEPDALPDSDLTVRYIYFFKNIKAELAREILGNMLDREGLLISADLNACIIKEKCFSIKAAMKIIKELDLGGLSEQIRVIPLNHANSETVAQLFQEILQTAAQQEKVIRFAEKEKKERTYFSTSTKIFSDASKNTLILFGTEKNINKVVEFIYKYIDIPIGGAQSRLHIKEIKYAKAEDLKLILDEIVKPPAGQASDKSIVVGEYKFFEDVVISAERATEEGSRGGGNRLIVACKMDDWKRLEGLIAKLDKPQPQVALEIMILNIDVDQKKQLGSQLWQMFGHKLGMGINEVEFRNLSAGKIAGKDEVRNYIQLAEPDYEGKGNPMFISLGKAATQTNPYENVWSMIKMVATSENSNVIAQPFLVTNNNQPCHVDVTRTYRIYGQLESTKGELSKRKVQDAEAAISVEITPKMNLNGTIDLDINIKVDEWINPDPTIGSKFNRALKTKASMLAGEVLSLGGLTKRTDTEDVSKTPILGDIPIIGSIFFKNKKKTQVESNLYIFIRPSIIKPKFEGAPDEYTQLKLDYAKYQLFKTDTFVQERDPIQRWFFKPPQQSIKQKLSDVKNGIVRPLDDFVLGKATPKLVNIKADSYFKVSEEIAKYEEELKKRREKEPVREVAAGTVTLN
jgi:general secretion pathway protein D